MKSFLTGILGERHDGDMICPNLVVARDFDSASDSLDILSCVRVRIEPASVDFCAPHTTLRQFAELIQRTALDEILGALGWVFSIEAEAFLAREVECIRLIQKHRFYPSCMKI